MQCWLPGAISTKTKLKNTFFCFFMIEKEREKAKQFDQILG